jgi:TlyA family rRNA methyltransferase/putative hemolysin
MQGLLELSGIPYVGCDTLSSACSMDKAVTNTLADNADIAQAKWLSIIKEDYVKTKDAFLKKAEDYLKYPIFVKPANAGSSVGISKAADRESLEKAMDVYGIRLDGMVCMDVGASTGGFTDCMLQNGAVKVYSVDVGHGQLDWKLGNDPRVVCMEKTNIRYVEPEHIDDVLDFASIDVSFISLTKVLGPVRNLLKDGGEVVCLIKPQFEAGREKVGKKGVVRDKSVHREVIKMVADFALSIGFSVKGLDFSPVKGPEGNIEYLLYIKKTSDAAVEPSEGAAETTGVTGTAEVPAKVTSAKTSDSSENFVLTDEIIR